MWPSWPLGGGGPAVATGTQPAPERPEGYVSAQERELPKAEPVKPEPPAASGPYAPGARPQRAQPKK